MFLVLGPHIFPEWLSGSFSSRFTICLMSKNLALSSSMTDFFAFIKCLPSFLISLLKCLFSHGRLCREFKKFDGMLFAKITTMY